MKLSITICDTDAKNILRNLNLMSEDKYAEWAIDLALQFEKALEKRHGHDLQRFILESFDGPEYGPPEGATTYGTIKN